MQNCNYDNLIVLHREVDRIREFLGTSEANVRGNKAIDRGLSANRRKNSLNLDSEVSSKGGTSCFVPVYRLVELKLREWFNDESVRH